MTKESLTLEHIKQDLRCIVESRSYIQSNRHLSVIIPVVCLAVLLGILFKNPWIGIGICAFAVYPTVRLIRDIRRNNAILDQLRQEIDRCDFSVSTERLSHISLETVHEPGNGRRHNTKTVSFFYFESGISWRVPDVLRHYPWSQTYNMTSSALDATSVKGNEFYVISLQSDHEIAYVYNTKLFCFQESAQFASDEK